MQFLFIFQATLYKIEATHHRTLLCGPPWLPLISLGCAWWPRNTRIPKTDKKLYFAWRDGDCIKNKIIRHTKKCFIADGLPAKVIPKVFFINVRVCSEKIGHTFSNMLEAKCYCLILLNSAGIHYTVWN